MEEPIVFVSDNIELEGLFNDNCGDRSVVITHPHPLYGGNMHNTVVEAIATAYHKAGYATLRFNFRGVGRSQGRHDNGVGEQLDAQAALSFLEENRKTVIDLAGYSFGAHVITLVAENASVQPKIRRLVLVSPPGGMRSAESLPPLSCLNLVVTGSEDDIAHPSVLKPLCHAWNPSARLEIIEGADHFYAAHIGQLASILDSYLSRIDES